MSINALPSFTPQILNTQILNPQGMHTQVINPSVPLMPMMPQDPGNPLLASIQKFSQLMLPKDDEDSETDEVSL